MKHPTAKVKSKFYHRGTPKIRATKKPTQKGAFGKKKKVKEFEIPDDPKARNLPKCSICGLPTLNKSSYGQPLCEWCKEDYKEAMGFSRFSSRNYE